MPEETFGDNQALDRQLETAETVTSTLQFSTLGWEQSLEQGRSLSAKVLADAQDILQAYRPLLVPLGWLVLVAIGLKLISAVLKAIDDIPLFAPLVELVGFGCTDWFIFRYLIKATDRQELSDKIQQLKWEVLGDES